MFIVCCYLHFVIICSYTNVEYYFFVIVHLNQVNVLWFNKIAFVNLYVICYQKIIAMKWFQVIFKRVKFNKRFFR